MNKKPIIIAIAIAVIVISIMFVASPAVNESSTQISNKTIQNSTTSKHYDVNLDEHVGVKTT